MIKFFRKIRQTLIAENPPGQSSRAGQMGKYMKYAIGEIILVMIGILLALQVSNWNQQRIAGQKEQLLLEALHEEFLDNRTQLERVISVHETEYTNARYMISQFPIDPETVNLDSLHSKGGAWPHWNTFNPSQGVIRSLVNTSSFELISDPELRVLLVSWEDVLADYKEEEDIAVRDLYEQLFPLISTFVSWGSGFNDNRADKTFMSTLEYENIYYRRANILGSILGKGDDSSELAEIRATIDSIIELSTPDEQ
jgi:hypothetical protein